MKTIAIFIGNSDDKLTQAQWHSFVKDVEKSIEFVGAKTHFFGGAPNWERWQNLGWLIDIDDEKANGLKDVLIALKPLYGQDSIAWLEGETEFI